MITFDEAYEAWYQKHLSESKGERKQKLEEQQKKSLEEGEDSPAKLFLRNVWWPLFGTLEDVFPEYEVVDFLGKTRFLDLGVRKYPLLADVEVDGYGSHLRDISRWAFADERRRDACLEIIGWNVIRFSYDDVKKNSLECQNILKHWMARWIGENKRIDDLDLRAKEIIKLAVRVGGNFSITEVMNELRISEGTARKLLRTLLQQKVLLGASKGSQRIHYYRLNPKYQFH